jgi:tetratricopeptide (TPR) repeat protein
MINTENGFDLKIKWRFPDLRKYIFVFISLAFLILTIYGNSFYCDWQFDDYPNIVNNQNVHLNILSWKEITKALYDGDSIQRPFAYLTFALNYYWGGTDVFGYHLVNVLIHFIASIFLFLFVYQTLKLPILKSKYEKSAYAIALLSTFFWAVSPVQVNAVTVIVQRMASMAGMFYIMSMYFYLKGRTAYGRWEKNVYFILCGVTCVFAFGSKENAIILPVIMLIYDILLIQGISWHHIIRKKFIFIFFMSLILFLLAISYINFSTLFDGYEIRPFTLKDRLLTQPRVILYYISLLLYPISSRLTFLHDIEISTSIIQPWTTLAAIILILLLMGLALFLSKRKPIIAFCILFFFMNHLIEGSFIPLELIFEHRNYIPSMLFFLPVAIVAVYVLDYFAYKKIVQLMVVFLIIFMLAAEGHTTHMRNGVLVNSLKLWYDNVFKSPNLSIVHNNLGKEYADKGLSRKAFHEFNKAIVLDRYINMNQRGLAYHNIGLYYQDEMKDLDRAYINLKKGLEMSSGYYEMWRTIIDFELKKGNLRVAYQYATKALKYWPDNSQLRNQMCVILMAQNQTDNAVKEAYKILMAEPDLQEPLKILGEACRRKNNYKDAIRYWEKYVLKVPNDVRMQLALVEMYHETKNEELLSRTIGRVISLKGKKDFKIFIEQIGKEDKYALYIPAVDKMLLIIREKLIDETPANIY